MKKFIRRCSRIALISLIFSTLFGLPVTQAQDLNSHTPYTITTYNLDPVENTTSTDLRHSQRPYSLLLITGFHSDILDDALLPNASGGDTSSDLTSSRSLVLSGEFNTSNRLAITGALGITQNRWDTELLGSDNGTSWEADLGLIYKIFDNLSYGVHLGYLDAGSIFAERASYKQNESIIMISNQLSLSF